MILYPNCKLNIGLKVVRKREDGYHDLETVFYPVYGLHDELMVEKSPSPVADGILFQQDGITMDCAPEDNLIVRCYRRMRKHYPQIGDVVVRFTKHIPFGAGLGGGSSDAAHMAIALNKLFNLQLSQATLAKEVKPLGADCPFFIYNTPCFAEGIGDILRPIDFSLKGLRLLMLKPQVSVSTREAYAGILPKEEHLDLHSDWHSWTNDFERTVFACHPQLTSIKQALLDAGAEYAAMSGSGSTIFGLFDDRLCQEGNTKSCADTQFRGLDENLTSMIIFNDTLGQAKS